MYRTETYTLIKRNKSKIKAMNATFFRSIEGKQERDRIRNEIFREAGTENILKGLENK
jgi:hypothetical protein